MIRAEQVRFQYKKRDVDGNVIATEEILKGVDLTIKKGEFIALLGRNGSGKTTFSKQLNAILRPSEGTVTVDEMGTKDADKLYEIRQRVGMVFQNPDNQMVAASVEEEVAVQFCPSLASMTRYHRCILPSKRMEKNYTNMPEPESRSNENQDRLRFMQSRILRRKRTILTALMCIVRKARISGRCAGISEENFLVWLCCPVYSGKKCMDFL